MTEGRHGAQFAIGKHFLEFILDRQGDGLGAGGFPQQMKIHLAVGRQHRHGHLAVEFDQDGLGEQTPGHTGLECHILGRVGAGVIGQIKVDFVFGEVFQEFCAGHFGPPHMAGEWGTRMPRWTRVEAG